MFPADEKYKASVTDEKGVVRKLLVYVEKPATALVVVGSVAVAKASAAMAAMDFTDVTISTADIFTFAGIILAAIGAIWGIKKLIAMGNKS